VGGQPFEQRLSPTVDEPFAGNTGAVRDFDFVRGHGELYVYVADWFQNPYDDSMPPMEHDFELTFTPVYDDGTEGQSFTTYGFNFPGGFGLNNLPLGRYRVSAVWKREGQEPVLALVRVRNQGDYTPAVEFGFSPLVPGVNQAEIEVKLPEPKP